MHAPPGAGALGLLSVVTRLGLLAPTQVARLASTATAHQASPEEALLSEHVLDREALEDLLAFQDELASGRPLARLVHREVLGCLPEAFVLKHRLLPLRALGAHLVVAHPQDDPMHLAPAPEGLRMRMRIDGVLADQLLVPPALRSALVTRFKLLAALNISERRLPQDGRFTWAHAGQSVDLRVATAPTHWGELVVIRLLKGLSVVGDLGALGMGPEALAAHRRLVASPHGIVLVTGPTGSGKSTTLYGTLMAQDRVGRNVISIEDPVEFDIEGVLQIQVHAAIGMTFAAALRSVLRLDPDTIFVGEIRDAETMGVALHAAMTGHLVLSTLHANSALATLGRMRELGADAADVAHALRGVVAQRLVRRLCARCKRPLRPGDPGAEWAKGRPEGLRPYFAPQGCPDCHGTGFGGRVGLFEVLSVDEALAGLLLASQPPSLQALSKACAMIPLAEDGVAKAAQGLTSLAEVERVARLP